MEEKIEKRIKRHKRIRQKLVGTEECPRLCVSRGISNLYVQLIDDIHSKTLVSVSTFDKSFKKKLAYGGNAQAAKLLGEVLAERAKKKGISNVIFDRAGFLYHGRIKALAEASREHGLKF